MALRRLEIANFRGVKKLSWDPKGHIHVLVGPGDSGKSSILSAIALLLSPRWDPPFCDADFHDGDANVPIRIAGVFGNLPQRFTEDFRYGLDLKGWTISGELHEEPQGEDELVAHIELTVSDSLEPRWVLLTRNENGGKPLNGKDREALGLFQLNLNDERHLSWGKGSALSRASSAPHEVATVMTTAVRAATAAANTAGLVALTQACSRVTQLAEKVSVKPRTGFEPRLDIVASKLGNGTVTLHDGPIPARLAGDGTRKLLSFALQCEVAKDGGLVLLDEIETGLEPHRLRNLVRQIRATSAESQVFVTTHSPVAVQEFTAAEIRTVHEVGGTVSVNDVSQELQPVLRAHSEAVLARSVIVCEGKTESGFVVSVFDDPENGHNRASLFGAVPVFGNGHEAPKFAKQFKELGYRTCLFADSDRDLAVSRPELESAGIAVFQWDGRCCIEERIAADLPVAGLKDVLNAAVAEGLAGSETAVRTAIGRHLSKPQQQVQGSVEEWIGQLGESEVRKAIGKAMNAGKWFKRPDLGRALGRVVLKHRNMFGTTPTWALLDTLIHWIEADA